MDKKHFILSILFILPFLGLEMSPVSGSWITSSIIWIAFAVLLVIYNKQFVKQIRIRTPFFLVSQHVNVKTGELWSSQRVEHDGVLWEATGRRYADTGRIVIDGPFCPDDLTPLALTDGDELDTEVNYDSYISDDDFQLVCIKCKTEYLLGEEPKQLRMSRNEAGNLLEGMKRREQGN